MKLMEQRRGHPLDAIFRPRSIAVVGASREPRKLGHRVIRNLFGFEFEGPVFPVNPRAEHVLCSKCYASLRDIPDPVDLAVVCVPRGLVLSVVQECAEVGIGGVVVTTAGFREIGPEGEEHELRLAEAARAAGIRMVGPNAMGVINTDPEFRMNATFGPSAPLPGNVSFLSQSGAMGVAIIDEARDVGLGLRMFVSVGNKADLSGNELLEYWADDPGTDAILMYLESFGDPRRFPAIAREVSRKKPVIAVKAGRTDAGALAATSHTGALSGMEVASNALLSQCGIIRVGSIEELFDVARAFAHQPLPAGDRVAILTNAGGPGIMATDACVQLGLSMASLSRETGARLREFLPAEASIRNPVDIMPASGAEGYRRSLELLLDDEGVDSIIVIVVEPPTESLSDIIAALSEVAETHQQGDKTLLACVMGQDAGAREGTKRLTRAGVPVYRYPESAARALNAMQEYLRWRARPVGEVQTFDVDRDRVKELLAGRRAKGGGYMSENEVSAVLRAYGIPTPRSRLCHGADEAVAAAEQLGYPVVMKLSHVDLVHKTDIGAVILGPKNELEVRGAYAKLVQKAIEHLETDRPAVLVQELVRDGVETIIGMTYDEAFGPLMMFGLGGVYVEVLKDVVFRVSPITDVEAREMVRSIKGYPLLSGFRGSAPVNEDVIVEALQRVCQLVTDHQQIAEFDINPLTVFPQRERCVAVDARIRVRPPDLAEQGE